MNWTRIALALVVPSAVAVAIALPFWLKNKAIVGNAIGACLIFLTAIFLAVAERVDVERLQLRCVEAGRYCPTDVPALFRQMAMYGLIAFVEVGALFFVSSIVEERRGRRHVDPEWR
jgi:hypothetical protein